MYLQRDQLHEKESLKKMRLLKKPSFWKNKINRIYTMEDLNKNEDNCKERRVCN
jgi:hypothetical protein